VGEGWESSALSCVNANPTTASMIPPIFHALLSSYRHALCGITSEVVLPKFYAF
jgi:hypothetical protein